MASREGSGVSWGVQCSSPREGNRVTGESEDHAPDALVVGEVELLSVV